MTEDVLQELKKYIKSLERDVLDYYSFQGDDEIRHTMLTIALQLREIVSRYDEEWE